MSSFQRVLIRGFHCTGIGHKSLLAISYMYLKFSAKFSDWWGQVILVGVSMCYRTARMAQDICRDLTAPLVALCVLKGGYQFFTDLLDFIKGYNSTAEHSFQMQVDFIRLKSYVVRCSNIVVTVTHQCQY